MHLANIDENLLVVTTKSLYNFPLLIISPQDSWPSNEYKILSHYIKQAICIMESCITLRGQIKGISRDTNLMYP